MLNDWHVPRRTIDSLPAVDPVFAQVYRWGELTGEKAKAFTWQDPAAIEFNFTNSPG